MPRRRSEEAQKKFIVIKTIQFILYLISKEQVRINFFFLFERMTIERRKDPNPNPKEMRMREREGRRRRCCDDDDDVDETRERIQKEG